jgi:formamidopyrimidine-DNA glycosylase
MDQEQTHNIFTFPSILEYITEDRQNKWFQRALNHLNVEFITDKKLKGDSYLSFYFYDQLSFGTLKAVKDDDGSMTVLKKKLSELGPDLLDSKTTFDVFKTQITKGVNKNKPIGNVIVNQKLVSGVGNYLRADALWMAKISPFRKVNDVTDKEMEKLYWSIISLIWGDYNFKEGMKRDLIKYKVPENYEKDFFIYRQEKDINDNKVIKEELYEGSQKRFIYWVKEIQK